jgi:hypothetical protein
VRTRSRSPCGGREVRIVLEHRRLAFPVLLGDLDPIEESGMVMRLEHLGYFGWRLGDATELGVAFQRDVNLDQTGQLDDATRSALKAEHGC